MPLFAFVLTIVYYQSMGFLWAYGWGIAVYLLIRGLIIYFVLCLGLAFWVSMRAKRRSFAFLPYFVLALLAPLTLAFIAVCYFLSQEDPDLIFPLSLFLFFSLLTGPMIALDTLRIAIKLSKENVRKAQKDKIDEGVLEL